MLHQTQPHRTPSGGIDGGYLAGPADEARAADVRLEDLLGAPSYVSRDAVRCYHVESTQTKTIVTGTRYDGLGFKVFTIEHPYGL